MLRERRESQLTNISEAGQGTNGAVCREREKQQRGRTTHKWCSLQRERERAIARVETACNMYSHRGARMARPSRALLVNSLVPSRPRPAPPGEERLVVNFLSQRRVQRMHKPVLYLLLV